MAEFEKKVSLIEIEVDNTASLKAVDKLSSAIIEQNAAVKENNTEIKSLNTSNKELSKEVKKGTKTQVEASKEIDTNNKKSTELQKKNLSLKDGIKDLNKERASAVKATKLQSNSLNALRDKIIKQKKELNGLNTSTVEGREKFDLLTKSLDENNAKISELDRAAGDYKTTVGQYKDEVGKALDGTDAFTGGMASAGRGFLTMARNSLVFLATPIGLVIAALAIAIMAVKAAFEGSEEGQNKFNKISAVIGVTIGNLMDLLADFGEFIIGVFENPQQAIKDFSDLIKQNIVNRFDGLMNLIPKLGEAISLLFEGKFSEAAKVATNAVAKVTLGVDGFTDKVEEAIKVTEEFFDATVKESKLAAKVADDRAKADLIARGLLVEGARLESEIAGLRLKARQEEEFSAEERKQALLDAQELQDTLLKKEQQVLRLRSEAITLENTFSRSNKENLDAEASAKAALLNIETRRLDQQRSTQRELNRINKEIEGDEKRTSAEIEKTQKTIDTRLLALAEAKRSASNEVRLKEAEDLKTHFLIKSEIENENFQLEIKRLEEERKILEENKALGDEERSITQEEINFAKEEAERKHKDILAGIETEAINTKEKKIKEALDKAKKVTDKANKASAVAFDIAQTSNENRFRKKFEFLENELKNGNITDEQYAKSKEALEKRQALASWKINKKQFLADKILTLSQIAIDTAKAIMKSVAAFPLTGGMPWSGISAGIGVAQAAAVVIKKPPPAPSFADGGDVFGFISKGASHANGGETWTNGNGGAFEVQGGEGMFVTKREATNPALQMLNKANTEHGGRSMFDSASRFLEDGGVVNGSGNDENTIRLINQIMANIPTPKVEVSSIMAGINSDSEANNIGVI